METPSFDSTKEAPPGGPAIGLVIADSGAERMCMLAMLCRDRSITSGVSFSARAPQQAVNASQGRDAARRMRSCEPLVGEVFHFAQALPGGLAIRRNDLAQEPSWPSVVVTKRVESRQWAEALERSRAWMAGSSVAFSGFIEQTAIMEAQLLAQPGDMSEPELARFRSFVLSVAEGMRAATDKPGETLMAVSKPRGMRLR